MTPPPITVIMLVQAQLLEAMMYQSAVCVELNVWPSSSWFNIDGVEIGRWYYVHNQLLGYRTGSWGTPDRIIILA